MPVEMDVVRKLIEAHGVEFGCPRAGDAVVRVMVGIVVDIDARRAIESPRSIRMALDRHDLPQYA